MRTIAILTALILGLSLSFGWYIKISTAKFSNLKIELKERQDKIDQVMKGIALNESLDVERSNEHMMITAESYKLTADIHDATITNNDECITRAIPQDILNILNGAK